MGISNLLQFLKPAVKPAHLSDFRGKRVAVDGNVWVHRGACACAADLFLGRPNGAYVRYCRANCQLLLDHGILPVLVFDGRKLGAKSETAAKRREVRQQAAASVDEQLESIRQLEADTAARPDDSDLAYELAKQRAALDRSAQQTICVDAAMVEAVMEALRQLPGVEV